MFAASIATRALALSAKPILSWNFSASAQRPQQIECAIALDSEFASTDFAARYRNSEAILELAVLTFETEAKDTKPSRFSTSRPREQARRNEATTDRRDQYELGYVSSLPCPLTAQMLRS